MILLIVSAVSAQEAELDQWLSKHHVYYNNLRGSRGIGPVKTLYSLEKLQKYLAILEGSTHQSSVVLMFYAYDSAGQKLSLWLIDQKGIQGKGETKLSADSMDMMSEKLMTLLQSSGSGEDRGAKIAQLKNTGARDPYEFWSACLFPGNTDSILYQYKYLLISPVRNLGMLPWYALKAPGIDDRCMIDYWTIEILESLSHFALIGKYENENLDGYTYSFNPLSPLVVCTPNYSRCKESSLPGAWEEAMMVGEKLGVEVRTGMGAHPDSLTRRDSKGGRYFEGDFIYIAAHAVSSSENPLDESHILLSRYPQNGCIQWTARDIMNVRKQPETLVVLSACETGKGKSQQAGVVGLSRSFLLNPVQYTYYEDHTYYGAQNVVMSLWNVNDSATMRLMTRFMETLKQPMPFFPAAHLRQAILNYREKDPNPIHWASFQVMGVPYPLWMPMNLDQGK